MHTYVRVRVRVRVRIRVRVRVRGYASRTGPLLYICVRACVWRRPCQRA